MEEQTQVIDQEELIEGLNDLSGFLSFKHNFILEALLECDNKIIFIVTGNQAGKTSSVMKYYIMRLWGMCPIEKRNLRPDNPIRTIRFASETLPMEADEGGEVRNTVYPQFKKFLPPSLVGDDITVRKPKTIVKDIQGGKNITLEFVSYNQAVQSQAGVQRFSIFLDEHSPKMFYEEQLPRLLAAGGDIIFGITPVEEIGWEYEDIFQKAKVIYNSPTIIQYYKDRYGKELERKEITNSKYDIAVIRAATDDNPTLNLQEIEDMMINYDDEATYETRRYGIFHQVSGVVYKNFESRIGDKDHFSHVISRDKYFPEGLPYQWIHARGIDYHEHTNWAIPWIAISTENEAFIYEEYNPSPDRMLTREIAREISVRSKDYHYSLNLIDPLSAKNQPSIGISVLDDLNRIFHELHRQQIGTGGFWQTWDTKSERGYDIVKERLMNSRICGKPFSNRSTKDGKYLPTLWILDNCPLIIHMFKNWKWEVWANKEALVTKEEKNKRQDKYSHFPISIECIFKHPAFSVGRFKDQVVKQRPSPYKGVLARA